MIALTRAQKLTFGGGLLTCCALGSFLLLSHTPHQAATANTPRIATTTMAQTEIFDALGLPLVAVPTPSAHQKLPQRYAGLPQVGNHTSPNIEQLVATQPTQVYVDANLLADYQAPLAQAKIETVALPLQTLADLKKTVTEFGHTYQREAASKTLTQSLTLPAKKRTPAPKVMILLGMPGGSFLVGGPTSYLGDLVSLAGGQVIGAPGDSPYQPFSTEQTLTEQPDLIITLAHGMVDTVQASFQTTFESAPWTNLKAVKQGHVFQADPERFGLTANLQAPKAYDQVNHWLDQAGRHHD